VCQVASSVIQPAACSISLWDVLAQCPILFGTENVAGEQCTLSYTSDWFQGDFLSSHWLRLYGLCQDTSVPMVEKMVQLLFSLSAHAYSNPQSHELHSTLVCIIQHPLVFLPIPSFTRTYNLIDGLKPTSTRVGQVLEEVISREKRRSDEKEKAFRSRQNQFRLAIPQISAALVSQWPKHPQVPPLSAALLFPDFLNDIEDVFQNCSRNHELFGHIQVVQASLLQIHRQQHHNEIIRTQEQYSFDPAPPSHNDHLLGSSVDDLLLRPPPHIHVSSSGLQSLLHLSHSRNFFLSSGVQSLTQKLSSSLHPIQRLFGKELEQSSQALLIRQRSEHAYTLGDHEELLLFLKIYHKACWNRYQHAWEDVYVALRSAKTAHERILSNSGLWPSLTPWSLLRLLSFDQRSRLPEEWKQALMSFAKTIVEYQRSRRLFHLVAHADYDGLLKEMENDCTSGLDNIDWLLVQVSNLKVH
jgi:hypothetical protein